MMSFTEAVFSFYRRYADFSGRSIRSEYWWAVLWQLILLVIILIPAYPWLLEAVAATDDSEIPDPNTATWITLGISLLFFLGHIIPIIALEIRRWHDLDKTGWFYLLFAVLGAIPVVGFIFDVVNLVWFCFKGTEGENQYGPDPFGDEIAKTFN